MAIGLPQAIPKGSPLGVASYDYTDLASGLGIVVYYGGQEELNGNTERYFLGQSTDIYSTNTNSTYTGSASQTYNFDSPAFNLPRTAKGNALIQFTYECPTGLGGGNSATSCRIKAQLFKLHADGSTTTALSSVATAYHDGTGGTSALAEGVKTPFCYSLALTQTIIKKGEKLRVAITLENDDGESVRFYHEPSGTTDLGTGRTSQVLLFMTFRIDI